VKENHCRMDKPLDDDENDDYIILHAICCTSQGSSVSIVSDYVLDDRAIRARSPAEARGFFL
jgi:hypothetical protein